MRGDGPAQTKFDPSSASRDTRMREKDAYERDREAMKEKMALSSARSAGAFLLMSCIFQLSPLIFVKLRSRLLFVVLRCKCRLFLAFHCCFPSLGCVSSVASLK